MAVWIPPKQLFKRSSRVGIVSQIVLVDFADRKQRFDAMLAPGILTSQIFVFTHRRVERHIIFEMASHFSGQLRYRKSAAIGFARGRRLKHNSPISRDHRLVFTASAGLLVAAA